MTEATLKETDRSQDDALRVLYEGLVGYYLHECKNALRNAIGVLETLQYQATKDSEVRWEAVTRATQQLRHLADSVMALPGPRDQIDPVDVNEVIRRVVHGYRGQLRVRNIVTDLEHIPHLLINRWELMTLFQVLLSNAARAVQMKSEHRPAIRIGTAVDGEGEIPMVVIRVRDNGVGMTAEQLSLAFKPGYSTWGDAGYGLAIAKHLIDRHGGSLTLDSKHGEGTTVTARIPLKRYQAEAS